MKIKLALFASGAGSNALNLLEVAQTLPNLQFALLVVDQPNSPLLQKVKVQFPNITVALIPSPKLPDPKENRKAHEELVLSALREHKIQWIFLAGYMRILGETLLNEYSSNGKSRIVNIHPSLLPAYPGLHAYERAFSANDEFGGVTVHLVDSGIDTGPLLKQEKFKRLPNDTLFDFIERGKALEWKVYGEILRTLNQTNDLLPPARNS